MIIGTGIDIVEISRIRDSYGKWGERFLSRVLTGGELSFVESKRNIYPYIASRFAAKEAFLKALGTGLSMGISWMDIEVKRKKGQRPFFNITGKARDILERDGVKKVHLSISHEKNYAVAQVILEG